MPDLTENDIGHRCGHSATEAGRRHHQRVRVVEFSRQGGTIHSIVKSTEEVPYRQTIVLSERRGGVEIAGRCSCPVRTNCEHVAAALFHALTVASVAGAVAHRPPESRLPRAPDPGGTGFDETTPASGSDLPPDVRAWLEDLTRASETPGESYPPDIIQRMIYVLVPIRDEPRIPQLGVQRCRRGTATTVPLRRTAVPIRPAHRRPEDLGIFARPTAASFATWLGGPAQVRTWPDLRSRALIHQSPPRGCSAVPADRPHVPGLRRSQIEACAARGEASCSGAAGEPSCQGRVRTVADACLRAL